MKHVQALMLMSLIMGFASAAAAQTATFACPKSQITVEYSKGTKTVWTGAQDGQACITSSVGYWNPNRTSQGRSYGPTISTSDQSTPAYIRYVQSVQPKLWPLQVGKSFTDRYEGPGDSGYAGIWRHKFSVDAFEKVVTPAGTFDAFKVTRIEEGTGSYKSTWTMWYAPSLNVNVKYDFRNSEQLSRAEEAVKITH